MADTTQRDALARNLCARLCDERKTLADLQAIDGFVDALERYDAEPTGGEAMELLEVTARLRELALRLGPVHADLQFVIGLLNCTRLRIQRERVEAGLTELRRQASWPSEVEFP